MSKKRKTKLIAAEHFNQDPARTLPLAKGRKLYEDHINRPRVAGGVAASTQKRYRTVFNKFISFAQTLGVHSWNAVTGQTLNAYASHLDKKNHSGKSLMTEIVTLVQAQRWLIDEKHLVGVERLKVKIRTVEGQ